ncbi:MAG TPA: hypothetical protein VN048_04755 [Verrucomicrobiae bacterium]|jgi:hypothetical protein|nr:hypothetical protein [Verrucomicrobiae bacterium]
MKKHLKSSGRQPEPFTSGVTKGMVREHALRMFQGKLEHESLTLEDWVLAEKDLVDSLEADGLLKR